jgi:hypothetical protein
MTNTHLWILVLGPLVDNGTLTIWQAVAIYRCLVYSDQIADNSIGNMFRPDVAALLEIH